MIVTDVVERMPIPSEVDRQALAAMPGTDEAFRRAVRATAALNCVELKPPYEQHPAIDRPARIASWNAERLKYIAPSATLLAGLKLDAVLLTEVDLGMARSGNLHRTADLAGALGHGSLFGTEFVELGLGDARERAWHAGQTNAAGLHGGAITSPHAMRRPALIRLETSGRWFDGGFGERRVGGRIGMAATIEVMGEEVLLVAVHYESHTGPADRLLQTRAMLAAIESHAPGLPVLIGGDFNTNSFERDEKNDDAAIAAALRLDPERLMAPMAYEPMFAELAERGFDWLSCNRMDIATQRTRPDGTPKPPFGKIDWFFARGLHCAEPTIVPAVDAQGVAISDHEVLVVTIAPDGKGAA